MAGTVLTSVMNLRLYGYSSLTMFLFELCLRTLCTQWTYHVTPARLLVRFPFHITCYQLGYLYVSLSCFTCFHMLPFWIDDWSTLIHLSYAYSFWVDDLSTDSLFLDYDLSTDSLFLDYDSSMTHFPFTTICTCIS